MKDLLNRAINSIEAKGVDYGDVRVVEHEQEAVVVKNGIVEAVTHTTDAGFGIRVLKDSAWGFSSSNIIKKSEVEKVAKDALSVARASALVRSHDLVLSRLEPQRGTYTSKYVSDPLKISLDKKIDLLMSCDKSMRRDKRIQVSTGLLSFRKKTSHFASTDGSLISQEMIFSGGMLRAHAIDKGEVQSRSFGNFGQAGYEFINSLDLMQNADRIRDEAVMLLSAKPCPQMETAVILDADQMVLQVHESCGHPAELDRVLGTEASYAGTSFITLDKLNTLQYGSELVNIVADATAQGGLGTFGWDDEGVPAQRFYLVKNGVFVGYLSSRETAPLIKRHSSGSMRADGWGRIPLIRMTNINLVPGQWGLEDMIGDTDDGVFMMTNRSWSIDDKRLNFQFGCEFARRIKKGKLTDVYKNATYTGITPQFWCSCDALGDKRLWKLFGVPNCGKGEPGQVALVGHGAVPARFRNVQIGIAR